MSGFISLLGDIARTRVELAALDVEEQVRTVSAALTLTIVAGVLALVAVVFVGIAVIALFWETHRVFATLAATSTYVFLAIVLGAAARSKWRARPATFSMTLRELEKDRDALRGRS